MERSKNRSHKERHGNIHTCGTGSQKRAGSKGEFKMKSIIKQVEEFMEGVFSGNIITFFQKDVNEKEGLISPLYFMPEETSRSMEDLSSQLIKLMIQFIDPSNINKKETATKLYVAISGLRLVGMIQNNPNSIKELDFYKNENSRLIDENKKHKGDIKKLMEQILTLSSSPQDKKVGIQ